MLQALLYETSPVDPVVLSTVLTAVFLVVAAGAVLPARAASAADPATALRD